MIDEREEGFADEDGVLVFEAGKIEQHDLAIAQNGCDIQRRLRAEHATQGAVAEHRLQPRNNRI